MISSTGTHAHFSFSHARDSPWHRHAEHALDKVAARLKEGVPVDWQDIVSRFTMDSATEFLFGKDVRSLDAPTPYPSTFPHTRETTVHPADRFVRSFQDGLEATAMRGRFLQSYPLFEFWGDKVEKHLGEVHKFIDPIVGQALRRKAERQRAGEDIEKDVRDDETLLEHLVKFTDGTSCDCGYLGDRALTDIWIVCRREDAQGRNT